MSVLQYLHSRNFNTSVHKAWIDEDEGVATIPLWNLSGRLVGYQNIRPDGDKKMFNNPYLGKYFTKRQNKVVGVWGLESWSFSDTLFVTEGIFDAARFSNMGLSAVATLANDLDPSTANWFWTIRQTRLVIVICDGDQAGLKLKKAGHLHYVMPDGEDFSSVSDEYVKDFLSMINRENK